MPVETPSLFARVIQDHLELKRRNAELEPAMPLEGYRIDDPFNNHPLFKTEEQARLEETMDGDEPAVSLDSFPLTWPGEESVEHVTPNGRRPRTPASGRSPATSTGATSLRRSESSCGGPEVVDEVSSLALSRRRRPARAGSTTGAPSRTRAARAPSRAARRGAW